MDTSHGLYTFSFAHAVTVYKCDAGIGRFQGESLGISGRQMEWPTSCDILHKGSRFLGKFSL